MSILFQMFKIFIRTLYTFTITPVPLNTQKTEKPMFQEFLLCHLSFYFVQSVKYHISYDKTVDCNKKNCYNLFVEKSL